MCFSVHFPITVFTVLRIEISRSVMLGVMAPRGASWIGHHHRAQRSTGVRSLCALITIYSLVTQKVHFIRDNLLKENKIMYLQFWTHEPATVFKLANRHYEEFMEKIGRPPVIGQEKPENVQKGNFEKWRGSFSDFLTTWLGNGLFFYFFLFLADLGHLHHYWRIWEIIFGHKLRLFNMV